MTAFGKLRCPIWGASGLTIVRQIPAKAGLSTKGSIPNCTGKRGGIPGTRNFRIYALYISAEDLIPSSVANTYHLKAIC